MTVARSFIDTNILVYTDDATVPAKQEKALVLIEQLAERGQAVLSTQVLQEYFYAVTRKLKVKPEIARRKLEIFARFDITLIDVDLIFDAVDLQNLHRLSFWDSLIVQAALRSDCQVLYSEDMQGGSRIRNLKIINPFQ